MSVELRKRPCPACDEQVRPREVFESGECPECGTSREDLFIASREDPTTLGGVTD